MQPRIPSPVTLLHLLRKRSVCETLMAKAAYEPLDPKEQSRLDKLCEKYPEMVKKQEEYVSLVEAFRLPTEELPFDLTARLHAQLERPAAKRQVRGTVYATVAAVAVLLISANLVFFFSDGPAAIVEQEYGAQSPAPVPMTDTPEAKLKAAMDRARELVSENDLMGGAAVLEQAIETAPIAPYVGEALLQLGDIEYSCLQRYDRAYVTYDKLCQQYPEVFVTSQEGEMRYKLLAEARRENYSPLYKLDVARVHTTEAFPICEDIIVSYPDTMLANEALEEMYASVTGTYSKEEMDKSDKLEFLRGHCSNPDVVAQIDLALGHYYNDLNERELAKRCYQRAENSNHVVLVQRATEALARMK